MTTSICEPLGVGLYGINGHQVDRQLLDHPRARCVAVAGFPAGHADKVFGPIPAYPDLATLLADPAVRLVVLCSPRRADQARDTITCLRAGRHVLAEKPCAMDEASLDAILRAAGDTGCIFHEMAGTAFESPWSEFGEIVRSGRIGRVRQVFAQKSYPDYDGRIHDPQIDGGLLLQVGIHAARWIDHSLGLPILGGGFAGAHDDAGRTVAISGTCHLEGGAIASIILNYRNPRGFGSWGNDCLRVWGDSGMIEATDAGARTRLVVEERDLGPFVVPGTGAARHWFDRVVDEILDDIPMPASLEVEVRPLRSLLRCQLESLPYDSGAGRLAEHSRITS
jgi:predicted dehydrogenase